MLFMGKLTISMVIFQQAMFDDTRGYGSLGFNLRIRPAKGTPMAE